MTAEIQQSDLKIGIWFLILQRKLAYVIYILPQLIKQTGS